MKHYILIVTIGVLLFGCGYVPPTPTSISTTPTPTPPAPESTPLPAVQLWPVPLTLDYMPADEEELIRHGVDLDIRGIYGLNANLVFLYGGLKLSYNGGAESVASLVLRSYDQGKHWQEVMPRAIGSNVIALSFVDDGEGWALVTWAVEACGAGRVYHTKDYGWSWVEQSEVPEFSPMTCPTDMRFNDQQSGWIKLYDPDNGCRTLDTTDGGDHWQFRQEILYVDTCKFADNAQMTTQDGIQWQVVVKDENKLQVSRRLASEKAWTVVSNLPRHYSYEPGRVLPP